MSAANGPLTEPGSKSQPHGQGQVRGSSALPGSVSDSAATTVEPHPFRPLRWFDAFVAKGRCRHCFLPRFAHPVPCWVPSRPWGDKSLARISWETLHGTD